MLNILIRSQQMKNNCSLRVINIKVAKLSFAYTFSLDPLLSFFLIFFTKKEEGNAVLLYTNFPVQFRTNVPFTFLSRASEPC